MNDKPGRTFTGYQRRKETRLSVRVGDITARSMITIGGIGTIIAVSAVFLFLVSVAAPLFSGGRVEQSLDYDSPWATDSTQPLHMATDDHQSIGWAMTPDGMIHVFRLDTGELIHQQRVIGEDQRLTASSFGGRRGDVIFGYETGSIQRGTIQFITSYLEMADVPAEMRSRPVGELMVYEDGVIVRTPANQFRKRQVRVELDEAVPLEDPSPIVRLSHTTYAGRTMLVSYTLDGRLLLSEIRERRNLLTGEVRVQLSDRKLPFTLPQGREAPDHVAMAGLGDNIFVIWNDGHMLRYDLRDRDNPRVVEALDLVEETGETITAVSFLLGRHSLVTGDSLGRVRVWFRVPEAAAARAEAVGDAGAVARVEDDDLVAAVGRIESDGVRMVNAHELRGPTRGTAVTALGRSVGSRMLSAGYADGTVRVFQVTANNLIVETQADAVGEQGVASLTMTPRDDGVLAVTEAGVQLWRIDRRYPAVTLRSVITPVWYEDYASPQHLWQSSSGQDDFEPKYGLAPLIFGTLKATFYSMLFGLPLAVLAAIYTSEFLHRKVRSRIKPIIEMMASLPSVVLGFVAALVIAPVVEQAVPAALLAFLVVPMIVLLGGFLWQLLPYAWHVRLTNWRFAFIAMTVLIALPVAFLGGPIVEQLLFAGDIRAWLSQDVGSGVAGWFLLMMPISAIVVAVLFSRYVNPVLRERFGQQGRRAMALADLAKYGVGIVLTMLLSLLLGSLLVYGLGWDPRGGSFAFWGMDLSPLKTYEQRNALIVGFVMGFAIIPIIYTISEDALSAVPEHLRSASLGAGATPWQTAMRLIVPTAMSGLFSAAMIGLGRAAGETMIVLMAAGNTPLMEMNIFNGFRTLSANIAVELPEAAVGGTHFRMLFLAALTLFVITFAVNTFAEVVRLRFRKRAFQL
ncbi:ABC transporter permease subunit [Phycisphaerales bacterium AB-hyl4]|uniref:ABC transporter permease subunit n=1 Tax=Natronomicrosphaera hydrolytica TaxID=3242702 RepID=A0ABV4UBP1_9BACT